MEPSDRHLQSVPPPRPQPVEWARALVDLAAESNGDQRLDILRTLNDVRDSVTEAIRGVETLIHEWIQEHGETPPGHGSKVAKFADGTYLKAAWKGGSSSKIPATEAVKLYGAVAQRIAETYDFEPVGKQALAEIVDQVDADDDFALFLAMALSIVAPKIAADARQQTLDVIAQVYPVTGGSASPRKTALAKLDINPDLYTVRGTSGNVRSFTTYQPPVIEEDPSDG